MRRARPMPPEERRRALVEATIPLIVEHGADVSTRQVADAAGVAEGTIFRVFGSKDDLIHSALTHALTDHGLEQDLAAIAPDADLTETVTAIAAALAERVTRMRALIALFHRPHAAASPASGTSAPNGNQTANGNPTPNGADAHALRCERPDPRDVHAQLAGAAASALERHAASLRVTPQRAAGLLLALTFGATHPISGDPAAMDPAAIADLILHGITKDA